MLSSLLEKFEPSLQLIRAFYTAKPVREQRVLQGLAVVVAAALFYGVLLAPLNDHLEKLRADIKHDEATLAWAQSADKLLAAPNAVHAHALTPVEALAALQTAVQAAAFSGSVKSLKQTGDHSISLQLAAVPFDQLILFLGEFDARNAMAVSELTVSNAGTALGVVNVGVVFTILQN